MPAVRKPVRREVGSFPETSSPGTGHAQTRQIRTASRLRTLSVLAGMLAVAGTSYWAGSRSQCWGSENQKAHAEYRDHCDTVKGGRLRSVGRICR